MILFIHISSKQTCWQTLLDFYQLNSKNETLIFAYHLSKLSMIQSNEILHFHRLSCCLITYKLYLPQNLILSISISVRKVHWMSTKSYSSYWPSLRQISSHLSLVEEFLQEHSRCFEHSITSKDAWKNNWLLDEFQLQDIINQPQNNIN